MNVADNARRHASSFFLVRIDLQDFFPSLRAADVERLAETSLVFVPGGDQWSSDDIDVFVCLCCKDGRLTIGAPTSPPLCNALCYHLDLQLTAFAQKRELTYSRYADDLVFSARAPDQLRDVQAQVAATLQNLEVPRGLKINTSKTVARIA